MTAADELSVLLRLVEVGAFDGLGRAWHATHPGTPSCRAAEEAIFAVAERFLGRPSKLPGCDEGWTYQKDVDEHPFWRALMNREFGWT